MKSAIKCGCFSSLTALRRKEELITEKKGAGNRTWLCRLTLHQLATWESSRYSASKENSIFSNYGGIIGCYICFVFFLVVYGKVYGYT